VSPVVDLVGVEKTFRDFWGRARVRALAPLTLSLDPGEVLALLGPNGAGKSTTIKLVLGLLFPTRGALSVFGQRPDSANVRARIGYLPEETKLHAFLTARETLHLFGRLHGVPPRERARRVGELLAMVGLSQNENRPVGEFSKGMARRIGLAVALVGDPDLLILDEPTSGLDPLGTREIKDLISELRARGRSILLSSHLLDDVEDVADRVAILYGGRLVRLGSTQELLTQGERVRIEFARPADFDPRAAAKEVERRFGIAGGVDVDNPAARLETLFREVVQQAAAERQDISGAQVGGVLASFFGAAPGGALAGPEAEPAGAGFTSARAEAESAAAPWGEPEQLGCEGEGARDEPPRDQEAESAAAPWGEPEQLGCEGEGARDEPPRDQDVGAGFTPARAEPEAKPGTPKGRAVLAALTEPEPEPAPASEPAAPLATAGPAGRQVLAGLLSGPAEPEAPAAPATPLAPKQGRQVLGALLQRGRDEPEVAEAPADRPAPKLSAAGREVLDGLI